MESPATQEEKVAPKDWTAEMAEKYRGPLGFFRRHYNGDYSLGRSYWANTLLVAVVAPMLAVAIVPALAANFPARYASIAALVIMAFALTAYVWAIVGTWASSNKHTSRGGREGWATAAKLFIVLGVLRTVTELAASAHFYEEHLLVAMGRQLGADVIFQVRADGKSVELKGGINDGTAEGLESALKMAPSVTTVVLQSKGGWLRQGSMIADVIAAHNLNTYVEDECSSACTIAFLAGKERTIDPRARIGFHSPRSVGALEKGDNVAQVQQLTQIYRSAGLPAAFIGQAMAQPTEAMWYPTQAELLESGVLTRASLGNETAIMATEYRTRAKLASDLVLTPMFAVLKERHPEIFEEVVEAAWEQVQARRPDADVITAVRTKLAASTRKFLPQASDALLMDFYELLGQQAGALSTVNTEACTEFIFPTGNSSGLLPKEMVKRALQLNEQLLRTSDPKNVASIPKGEAESLMTEVFAQMPREQLDLITDATKRKGQPQKTCGAIVAYFNTLNAIPRDKRARALRVLIQ